MRKATRDELLRLSRYYLQYHHECTVAFDNFMRKMRQDLPPPLEISWEEMEKMATEILEYTETNPMRRAEILFWWEWNTRMVNEWERIVEEEKAKDV